MDYEGMLGEVKAFMQAPTPEKAQDVIRECKQFEPKDETEQKTAEIVLRELTNISWEWDRIEQQKKEMETAEALFRPMYQGRIAKAEEEVRTAMDVLGKIKGGDAPHQDLRPGR